MFNFYIIFIAALVPLVMGFLWYNPKTLGGIWQKEVGLTNEQIQSGNFLMIYGLAIVFSIILASQVMQNVIHQLAALQMVGGDLNSATQEFQMAFNHYQNNHRSFGHGVLHGTMLGITLVFPIIATNGMFERKSWKLIFINSGYWILSLGIMGGILGAFS